MQSCRCQLQREMINSGCGGGGGGGPTLTFLHRIKMIEWIIYFCDRKRNMESLWDGSDADGQAHR